MIINKVRMFKSAAAKNHLHTKSDNAQGYNIESAYT